MKPVLSTFFLILCSPFSFFAQSNILAGGATVGQVGECPSNTIRLQAWVYSAAATSGPEREDLLVTWGDGTTEVIARSNDPGNLPGEIFVNFYERDHTYDGPGAYTIQLTDCCLAPDFINVNDSGSIPMLLNYHFRLFNGQFLGCNRMPQLIAPLIDFGVVDFPLIYSPGAFDPDGDSLSFQLMDPLPEMSYQFPDEIIPGFNNQFSIDGQTGTMTWNSPQQEGRYLVGLKTLEHRFGEVISEGIFWLALDVKDLDIAILPNPVSTVLTVRTVPEVGNEAFNLRIYNVLGQLVHHASGSLSNGRHTIDVRDFANGAYFLTFEAFGRQWTKKFIKS